MKSTERFPACEAAPSLKDSVKWHQPVSAAFLMAEMNSGIEQVLQREELRHMEEVRLLKRQVHDFICTSNSVTINTKQQHPGTVSYITDIQAALTLTHRCHRQREAEPEAV